MPPWWSKSSCKEAKQNTGKRSFIDSIRKFKHRLGTGKFGGSERYNINTFSKHETTLTVSALSSPQVSPCHSFNEQAQAQPLPHPRLRSAGAGHAALGNESSRFELLGCSKTSPNSPLCGHRYDLKHPNTHDAWGDLATTSVSSNSSSDTNDQPGSQLLSLQASDFESGNVTAINSPSRHKVHSSIITRRIMKDELKPYNVPCSNCIPITSTERKPFGAQVTKLQIIPRASLLSAPESSTASPSQSSVKASTHVQVIESGSGLVTPCSSMDLVGSGRSCYLSSDQISGPHPATDVTLIGPQSRGSPEYSPISSPRITSPGQVCHRQSGGATPLHCSARFCTEVSTDRADYVKPESHKLPLPPIPTPARYNGQPEMSKISVAHWKKGRLIGNGTFGQVFLSFNSDTGEMCAMKEVLLFSDDSKSKENSKQLEQEITLLSRLRHPNIVRYFGSEMVDDKLSIYLEYVSGGSINKILREYGALGESAIRSYTQQILAGLVYLHSKNTVHRDIKGANILVDPNGRVKLADFGMAKHITGQSCPFSFKGSPYWMAPEVIKNSSGCNLAVDVWSLGCTVIEMATTKPPWSQYEGVAALFKIGNSKEHPPLPDHLSEEGRDFVLRCLQRNPQDRPTAIQLLEHPFVRNAASPEKWMIISDPLEPHNTANNAERYRDNDHAKTISCLDLEGVAVHLSRGFKNGSVSRNPHTSKHISCPVSPIGSHVLQPKASEPKFSSKSPTASSQTASGSSTSCTNRNVTFPINHLDQTLPFAHDVSGSSPRYYKKKPEALSGVPVASRINGNIASCQSDLARSKPAQLFYEKPEGFCNRQAVLASRVSQQLLMDHFS